MTPSTGLRAGLARRIIACLDVRDGSVVKGIRFEDLRNAGDPAALARRYDAEGIDELVILDVTATLERRRALEITIRAVARELFIPLTVGGGIRSESDAASMIEAGADKVSVNTAALEDPSLMSRLAQRYGSQAVICAIDAKRVPGSLGPLVPGSLSPPVTDLRTQGPEDPRTYEVFARSGGLPTGRSAIDWAREAEALGAGEILLTSIDRDGTRAGFDCELTSAVAEAVSIPVIASGGAGTFDHFAQVFTAGQADAALAASVFHFSEHPVRELKTHLASRGIPMRIPC